jgi:ubiquitin-protein ligase
MVRRTRRYYEGVVLHCVLTFPKNYPHTSPKVRLCTPIGHKNVYGSWVCLDMLETQWWPNDRRSESTSDQYTGWTR